MQNDGSLPPPGWEDLPGGEDAGLEHTTVLHVRITHRQPVAQLDMLVAGSVHQLDGVGQLLVVASEQFIDGEPVASSYMRF